MWGGDGGGVQENGFEVFCKLYVFLESSFLECVFYVLREIEDSDVSFYCRWGLSVEDRGQISRDCYRVGF